MPDLDGTKSGHSGAHTPDHASRGRSRPDDEVSLLGILSILLERRVLIASTIALGMGMSLLLAARKPTLYTASVAFLAEGSDAGARGALTLAQRVGVSIGGGDGQRTPEFYADLVTSAEVLRQTVTETYERSQTDEERTGSDLVAYYGVEGRSEAERIQRAVHRLEQDISVNTDRETGVVTFSVRTSDPLLSQGVAQHILDLVQSFDLTTRQTQARAERQFTGERLAELTTELRRAEDSLEVFSLGNRDISNSPVLQFEHDRLQRVVVMRQELVTSLAQAYERARIEEVRNTPVLTLIDPPRVPAIRDPKGRLSMLVLGLILGAFGGVFAALMMNSIDQARRLRSADFEDLASSWDRFLTDVRVLARRPFRSSVR